VSVDHYRAAAQMLRSFKAGAAKDE
jgi:hypothetical protein